MVTEPAAIPVTWPPVEIVATLELPDVQTPPIVVLVKTDVAPTHNAFEPAIA